MKYHQNFLSTSPDEETERRYSALPRCSIIQASNSKLDLDDVIQCTPTVRFSKQVLLEILCNFQEITNRIPIEKFEADLFNVSKIHKKHLIGKKITIKCVQQIHHLKYLVESRDSLDPNLLIKRINQIILMNPAVTMEYNIISSLLDLFNGLLVKWNIASIKNYDYRYTSRVLNINLLDLNEINLNFMSINMLWISTKIFVKPLNALSSPILVETARVLHDQLGKCCDVFLTLNSQMINYDYDIEKALAFSSSSFYMYSAEVLPEQNMTSFRHAELGIAKGIMKCFKSPNPRIQYVHKVLAELELVFRSFEKLFIASLLNDLAED